MTLYQKSSGNIVSIDPRSLLDVDIKQEIDDLSEEPEEQLLQVSDETSVNQAVQKQFEDELYKWVMITDISIKKGMYISFSDSRDFRAVDQSND